ncbi:MAG: hypothetical protein JWM11_4646 [Planctomycetaceae bacterium]|nr:hypothetical protein [Planctomycetaceae bacterium]
MGLLWLLLLGIIGLVVGRVLARIIYSHGSEPRSMSQPNLKECPGCGTALTLQADACPKCGLRISV